MAKGKLLTVGSADYIKKNFGIGYHLNVYLDNKNFYNNEDINIRKNEITSYMVKSIKGVNFNK